MILSLPNLPTTFRVDSFCFMMQGSPLVPDTCYGLLSLPLAVC